MLVIENIPVNPKAKRNGLTRALFQLDVGQSVRVETNYFAAHSTMNSAKRRKKRPLKGEFKVVPDTDGHVRVGRIK